VPIVLAVAGPFMEGKRPRRRLVAAAVVVAGGAAIATGFGGGAVLGLLLALGALGGEVGFSLLALPLLPRLGAIRVSAYSAVAAVPLLLCAGFVTDGRHALRVPTASEACALGYLAVVVTAFAFFCWYDALPRLGPERAGLFSGLLPVGAIVSTMVLGTGHPSPADVVGAGLVIAGLLIGLRTSRPDGSDPVGPVAEETAGRAG
jgi:drug/metabolite transporter (DMT)-like permease